MKVPAQKYMRAKGVIPAERYVRSDAFGPRRTQERRRPARTGVVSASPLEKEM